MSPCVTSVSWTCPRQIENWTDTLTETNTLIQTDRLRQTEKQAGRRLVGQPTDGSQIARKEDKRPMDLHKNSQNNRQTDTHRKKSEDCGM